MSVNRDREEEIFDAARELAADERAAYLAERCGQDADLRQRIEGMLEADAAAHRLFLLGHIHHAAAAFADLLEQLVAANSVAGLFRERDIHARGSIEVEARRWRLEEIVCLVVRLEQGFDLLA